MQRTSSFSEEAAQLLICGFVAVISVDVLKEPAQFRKCFRAHPTMALDTFMSALLELFEVPSGFGHTNDRHVEMAVPDH
jgi:hypothetical protein